MAGVEIVGNAAARTQPRTVPRLGVLMLDTAFPRIPGDLGNLETWPFPALIARVRGATPGRVVDKQAAGLLEPFLAAGRALVEAGAGAIGTTCGFLSLFQAPLAAGLGVPVAASPLLLVPLIDRLLPAGKRAGVVTFSKEALTTAHLVAVGAAPDTPVAGVPAAGVLATTIRQGLPELDEAAVEAEVVDAARRLVAAHREVGALLLECANMPPYNEAVRRAVGLPVHDGYDFLAWLHAGVASARRFRAAPPEAAE